MDKVSLHFENPSPRWVKLRANEVLDFGMYRSRLGEPALRREARVQRIRPRGMFLWDGERKFHVRGVSYGPFPRNTLGDPLPEKQVVERDLGLIRDLGANSLRLYYVPPSWFRELAEGFGLRLPIQSLAWRIIGSATSRMCATATRGS